jgi:cytochrome c peroxidase
MGHFKAPTLRNVAVTAPYMHDGSIATLDEVLDHYAAGGRGGGIGNPYKSGFVRGFELSAEERRDLLEFLRSLTDEKFLRDPRFSDPWKGGDR